MVKEVIDALNSLNRTGNITDNAAPAAKRRRIIIDSDSEGQAAYLVPAF